MQSVQTALNSGSSTVASEIRTRGNGAAHRRELMVDGEPVSALSVVPRSVRICGVQVRMGGIGGVHTREEQRKKGYARRLISETVSYMTRKGYAISMLFGIPDFYHKFGYLPVIPEHTTTISTREAERAGEAAGSFRSRPVQEDDYPFVARLHNRNEHNRPACMLRKEGEFSEFRQGTDWERDVSAFMIEDEAGERLAYAASDKSETAVKVTEVQAVDGSLFGSLLHEFASMAVERRCGEIELHLPCDHPFVRYVRRCGCRSRVHYYRMAGGMMRILNQSPFLASLEPALAQKLRDAGAASSPARLQVETDLGRNILQLNASAPGQARKCRLKAPQNKLMQLLTGYRTPADLARDDDVEIDETGIKVLTVLQPHQAAYVYHADRF